MWEGTRHRDQSNGTLIAYLEQELSAGESRSFSREVLRDKGSATPDVVDQLMARLVADGLCTRTDVAECTYCHARAESQEDKCSECGTDTPGWRVDEPTWVFSGVRRRDLSWLIVLHGMNTTGAWQEEFSWRLSRRQGRSVPVLIYKYGNVLLTPALRMLQRKHARKLLEEIRLRISATDAEGPPDVIAHSFGTWLLAEALRTSDIRLGRVVLAGSIVDPTYDWDSLLTSGRVQAVLTHIAGRDCPVRIAQFAIPRSGPSGRTGFVRSRKVFHTDAPEFGHSSFFDEDRMGTVIETWGEFLTSDSPVLPFVRGAGPAGSWERSRFATPSLVVLHLLMWPLCLLLIPLLGVRALVAEWTASRPRARTATATQKQD